MADSGRITPRDSPPDLASEQEAAAVEPYLPEGYSGDFNAAAEEDVRPSRSPAQSPNEDEQISSLTLQGGDIHRTLFRDVARSRDRMQRSATLTEPITWRPEETENSMSAREVRAPGGFRRQYIQQQRGGFAAPVTRSFADFLALYGNFAGEILDDSDDDTSDEESQTSESRPLLQRSKTPRSRKPTEAGDAGLTKSFFTLLKAFVGTGILFLPKAFNNGGILFSSIVLVVVSCLTTLCFRLLLQCREKYGGSGYGDLGQEISGTALRRLILSSITISQLGFVCASLIFVAENGLDFLAGVIADTATLPSVNVLIIVQLLVLIPLSWIRNMSKLGPRGFTRGRFHLARSDIHILLRHCSHLNTRH